MQTKAQLAAVAIPFMFVAGTIVFLTGAYTGGAVSAGGSIRGTVRLQGIRPPLAAHAVPAQFQTACGRQVANEEVVAGAGGALANVVVWIDGIAQGAPAAPRAITVDQRGCRYVPRVQAATVGSTVTIVSSDATLHNVHAYQASQTSFNLAMPIKGMRLARPLPRPGIVELRCDAGHTWMHGFVHVFEHPYFAVTREDGAFDLRDVPPGRHTLKAWHERLGVQTGQVDVGPGAAANWNVSFAAR